jgi:hypothetical protein
MRRGPSSSAADSGPGFGCHESQKRALRPFAHLSAGAGLERPLDTVLSTVPVGEVRGVVFLYFCQTATTDVYPLSVRGLEWSTRRW